MSNLGDKITEQILKSKYGSSQPPKPKKDDEEDDDDKKNSPWSKLMAAMGG